jgi:hypothetical protein
MSPVAAEVASAASAPGPDAVPEAAGLERVVGEFELVAGVAAGAEWVVELLDEDPQPAIASVASSTHAEADFWMNCMPASVTIRSDDVLNGFRRSRRDRDTCPTDACQGDDRRR